jgi:hypothetical protein
MLWPDYPPECSRLITRVSAVIKPDMKLLDVGSRDDGRN